MAEKMNKLRSKIKVDTYCTGILALILAGLAFISIMNVVKYYGKEPRAFVVKMVEDKDWGKGYELYIDGDERYSVDFNEYSKLDKNGTENPKMCFIIDEINTVIRFLMMTFLFGLAYTILREIIKNGKPFTFNNVRRLRLMAVITMLTALIPGMVSLVMSFYIFRGAYGHIDGTSLLVLLLGVLLGIISEIFKYGCELQEDIDQIA